MPAANQVVLILYISAGLSFKISLHVPPTMVLKVLGARERLAVTGISIYQQKRKGEKEGGRARQTETQRVTNRDRLTETKNEMLKISNDNVWEKNVIYLNANRAQK